MKKGYLLLGFYLAFGVLSAQPSIQWQKTYGGSNWDQAYCIRQTSDGGYIVAGGSVSNDGDCFGNHGGDEFWVLKLKNNGTIQWKKLMGGNSNETAQKVFQTTDGGYLVAGFSASNNGDVAGNHGGHYDGWVVKLAPNGVIQWTKTYGGSGWDEFRAACQTTDNGYVFAGRSSSTNGDVTENKGMEDFWVVKTNQNGDIQWQKTYGGNMDDTANGIKQTSDGGYIIIGETSSTNGDVTDLRGNVDYWVLKIDANGIIEWQRALGGENADIATNVIQTEDGGYAVVGFASSHNTGDVTGNDQLSLFDYWIVKLDNSGQLIWQKTYGGSDLEYARDFVQTADGGFVIGGGGYSSNGDVIGNDGGADFWVVKVDANGELVWQQTYGGIKGDIAFAIDNTNDNGYIVAGYTFSEDGDLAGTTNRGYNDLWVVKLSPEATPTHEAPFAAMQLFPNPTTEAVTLKVPMEVNSLNVTITDAQGRAISQQTIDNGGTLNVKGLPPGIYQIAAKAGDRTTYFGKIEKL